MSVSLLILPLIHSPLICSLILLETANRHLEQLDILFSSDSCLAWRAEKNFVQKLNEQGGILGEKNEKGAVEQVERSNHFDTVRQEL